MEHYVELLERDGGPSGKPKKRTSGANPEVIRALLAKIAGSSNKIIKEHVYKGELSRRALQGVRGGLRRALQNRRRELPEDRRQRE